MAQLVARTAGGREVASSSLVTLTIQVDYNIRMTKNETWQQTKHGLYKRFNFINFAEAFSFMTDVAAIAEEQQHHPRWENEWSVVQIWLMTHEESSTITDKDYALADAIDRLVQTKSDSEHSNGRKFEELKLYTDGGSRGNPGPSASGFVLQDESGEVVEKGGEYLGITTNNQAEYQAVKLGLETAKKLGAKKVHGHMDSLLVVNQMNGIFKIKNRELWPIHQAIQELRKSFDSVTFVHVPREMNKLADEQVNIILDAEEAKNRAA